MKKIYLFLLGICLSVGYTWASPANLYLVGTATEGEWDTGKGTKMTKDGNYFYWSGHLKEGVFKFNASTTEWSGHFGYYGSDNDPANDDIITFTKGYGSKNAASHRKNIAVGTAGYYYIAVNYNNDSDINIYGQLLKDTEYKVSVPAGTQMCYIASDLNGWNFKPMAYSGSNTFSITISSDSKVRYKYSCGPDWSCNETLANGASAGNRTHSTSDQVPRWKDTFIPSFASIDFSMYGENTLAAVKTLTFTLENEWTNENLDTLKTALGNNDNITNITFENVISADVTDNYFSNINPNCLIYIPSGTAPDSWKNAIIENEAKTITLSDKKAFNCPNTITATDGATYTRECYIDGGWESIIFPFAVTGITDKNNENAKGLFTFEKFGEKTDNTIKFVPLAEGEELEANVPYIMRYTDTPTLGEKATFKFSSSDNAGVQTEINTTDFIGTYTQMTGGVNGYILNAAGNTFGRIGETSIINPFRAYLLAPTDPSNAPIKYSVIHGNEGGATNIDDKENINTIYTTEGAAIIHSDKQQEINIFGIDGHKVYNGRLSEGVNTINLPQGIYILNNQKVIIK